MANDGRKYQGPNPFDAVKTTHKPRERDTKDIYEPYIKPKEGGATIGFTKKF